MRKLLVPLILGLVLTGCATHEIPATKLEKANVLPLALDDDFQFRKQKLDYFDAEPPPVTQSETVNFERNRRTWGAVDGNEQVQRYGNYFTFFWRAARREDITIRLEYRQAALGNYVMAQERYYPGAKGSYVSHFEVIGDDFLEFGRVSSWRVVMIVDGRIVALSQSFIWK